jgi:hypothetical protein
MRKANRIPPHERVRTTYTNEEQMFQAGVEQGRRIERRALRREANGFPKDSRYRRWIIDWLASRTKPAKRKEG